MTACGSNEYYRRRPVERGESDVSTRDMLMADLDGLDNHNSLELSK